MMTESTSLTNQYLYASSRVSLHFLHCLGRYIRCALSVPFSLQFLLQSVLPSTSARQCRPCFRTLSTQSCYYASSTPYSAFSFPSPSSHARPPQNVKPATTRGCPASINPRCSSPHIPRAPSQNSMGTTAGGPCSPSPGWFLMSLGERGFMAQVSTSLPPVSISSSNEEGLTSLFVEMGCTGALRDGMHRGA